MNNMNFLQMLSQLKSNPTALLSQKYNIPQNVKNPQDILQHLMNSGQVSQEQYNQAMRFAKQFGLKK